MDAAALAEASVHVAMSSELKRKMAKQFDWMASNKGRIVIEIDIKRINQIGTTAHTAFDVRHKKEGVIEKLFCVDDFIIFSHKKVLRFAIDNQIFWYFFSVFFSSLKIHTLFLANVMFDLL